MVKNIEKGDVMRCSHNQTSQKTCQAIAKTLQKL
jgi:hypothetical protein